MERWHQRTTISGMGGDPPRSAANRLPLPTRKVLVATEMFAEPFRSPLDVCCSMRTCLACGTEIPDSRRKDARFCQKPACRARDFRRRKRQTEGASAHLSHSKATESFTVTCSCGSQILIQVTHLKPMDPPTPTSNQDLPPEAVTRTVANTADERNPPPTEPVAPVQTVTANSSHMVSPGRSVVNAAEAGGGSPAQPASLPPPTPTDMGPAVGILEPPPIVTPRVHWTCELFGVIGRYRVLPLMQALVQLPGGRVELVPGVALSMGRTRHDGHRLSGSPGAWRDFYPNTSPAAFGLDADLALVFWDSLGRRAVPVPVSVVEQLIGEDWRYRTRAALPDGV